MDYNFNQLKKSILKECESFGFLKLLQHSNDYFKSLSIRGSTLRETFTALSLEDRQAFINAMLLKNTPDSQPLLEALVVWCINLLELRTGLAVKLLFEGNEELLSEKIKRECLPPIKRRASSVI